MSKVWSTSATIDIWLFHAFVVVFVFPVLTLVHVYLWNVSRCSIAQIPFCISCTCTAFRGESPGWNILRSKVAKQRLHQAPRECTACPPGRAHPSATDTHSTQCGFRTLTCLRFITYHPLRAVCRPQFNIYQTQQFIVVFWSRPRSEQIEKNNFLPPYPNRESTGWSCFASLSAPELTPRPGSLSEKASAG